MLGKCMRFFVLILTALTVSNSVMASDAVLPPALDAALSDAEARQENAANVRFYFRRNIERFGEKFLEKSYNPAGIEGQQWAILHPKSEDDAGEYRKQVRKHAKKKDGADLALLMISFRDRLAKGVRLAREDDEEIVYSFEINDEYYVSGEGKGADIAKYMDGEIAVDKNTGMIGWVHYVAREPFRPIAIAKIRQFDIYQQFAPAWHEGPMVKVLEKNKVAGSAIIRKIEFDDVVANFDFRPIAEDYPVVSKAGGD